MNNPRPNVPNRSKHLILAFALTLLATGAQAHHSIASEYSTNGELSELSGTVTKIRWFAPHIEIYISATGGIAAAGDEWIVNSHAPGLLARTYGVFKEDVAVGDTIKFLGWKSNFDVSRFAMRALKINDGPMRSTLRPADQRAIKAGTLGDIVPAPGLGDGDSYAADVGAVITDTASATNEPGQRFAEIAERPLGIPTWLMVVVAVLLVGMGWGLIAMRRKA